MDQKYRWCKYYPKYVLLNQILDQKALYYYNNSILFFETRSDGLILVSFLKQDTIFETSAQ